MSKKDKKVVNSAVPGTTSVDSPDIEMVVGVVEDTAPTANALKASIEQTVDVFDECAFEMKPSAIVGKPVLIIGGKEVELAQMTPNQVPLISRGLLGNYFHDAHSGTHNKELFNKFADHIRVGAKELHFWTATVNSRLFILSKGARVTLGSSWDAGTAIFIASIVELERLTGSGDVTLVNTTLYGKSLYINGRFTVKHSTINADATSAYDTCSIRFSTLHCNGVLTIDSTYVYAVSFSGWTDIKLTSSNINKYGDKTIQICSRYSTKKYNSCLEISHINLGELDIPNRMFISEGDVIIKHRAHMGSMPGIDPVSFVQTTDAAILLEGELVLTLEDLEAMRYRVPMPTSPMLNDGYQPTPMPWVPMSVNKDGEVDKYDKLVRMFISGNTNEKVPQNTDQLLGIHFRPFYDALVSRVKLFRVLKALG